MSKDRISTIQSYSAVLLTLRHVCVATAINSVVATPAPAAGVRLVSPPPRAVVVIVVVVVVVVVAVVVDDDDGSAALAP